MQTIYKSVNKALLNNEDYSNQGLKHEEWINRQVLPGRKLIPLAHDFSNNCQWGTWDLSLRFKTYRVEHVLNNNNKKRKLWLPEL